MLSVVKEKPHFPVSVRKEHLLQRNDIWMLELPQQLKKKKSATIISIHPKLGYLEHKQQKLKSEAIENHSSFMNEPVIRFKPNLKAGHNTLRAFTSYSFPKSWTLCKPHYYPEPRWLCKQLAVASAFSQRLSSSTVLFEVPHCLPTPSYLKTLCCGCSHLRLNEMAHVEPVNAVS